MVQVDYAAIVTVAALIGLGLKYGVLGSPLRELMTLIFLATLPTILFYYVLRAIFVAVGLMSAV